MIPSDFEVANDCTEEEIELNRRVGTWLETTCAHAGCHQPVGPQLPMLSASNLPTLAATSAFDPGGYIMGRLAPDDPANLMPPTRHENPPEVIAMIERWVELR